MKKITALFLAVLMILSLAACGAEPAPAGEQSEAPAEAPASEEAPAQEAPAGLPNPMTEIDSMAELSEQANCALIRPEGAEIDDEVFYKIAGEPEIAEYDFTADGKACTLRFTNVGIDTDICGVYLDGSTLFADSDAETNYFQTDDVIAQRWFTVDGQYVFMVNTADGWEWADFDALCSQFMDMEPKTWSSDVPFADYMALTGSYSAGDGMSMAFISVRFDHALIVVYSYPDRETMYYWEMDAVLQDGSKLVYEKESISRRVVDESEDSFSAELVPEPDGGAGFVEILPDGSLSFAGAYSPELQGLILPFVG